MSYSFLLQSVLVQTQLEEMPLFRELIDEYSKTKPFVNQKIAIAHVLVPNTLPLIIACLVAGAEIKVTDCDPPNNDKETIELLEKAGVEVDHEFNDASVFDFAIDCNAYFKEFPPKCGISEVTRSGIHKFNENPITIPVVNCDSTIAKIIETFLGNPLAVERAFSKYIGPSYKILKDKKIVVLGFGKIGRGISRIFSNYGKVFVLDIDYNVLAKAQELGFENAQITDDKVANNELIKGAEVIFTATGHPNVVTNYFDKSCVNAPYLINIGAVDEFGLDYSSDEVFMSKFIPFNFNLTPPTENKYIDPILVAHVKGIEYLVSSEIKEFGVIDFPKEIDENIIDKFEVYNFKVKDLISKYFT